MQRAAPPIYKEWRDVLINGNTAGGGPGCGTTD